MSETSGRELTEAEHRTRHIVLVTSVAALGGFLFGFDTAVVNGAVGAIQDEFDASSFGIGLAVSTMSRSQKPTHAGVNSRLPIVL